MRIPVLAMLTLIASGCASDPGAARDATAICDGTERLRGTHATALAEDGGPLSVTTGRRLIATIDAGCAGGQEPRSRLNRGAR